MDEATFVASLWAPIDDEEISSDVKVYYDQAEDFLYLAGQSLGVESELIFIGEYK